MLWQEIAKTLYAKKGQYLFTMYLLTSNGQTDKELTLPTLLDLTMKNKTMKQLLLDFIRSTKFKTFCWTTLNGFLTLLIAFLGDLSWEYLPFIIALLNLITKYINQKYL
jgi:hypothetical protein